MQTSLKSSPLNAPQRETKFNFIDKLRAYMGRSKVVRLIKYRHRHQIDLELPLGLRLRLHIPKMSAVALINTLSASLILASVPKLWDILRSWSPRNHVWVKFVAKLIRRIYVSFAAVVVGDINCNFMIQIMHLSTG